MKDNFSNKLKKLGITLKQPLAVAVSGGSDSMALSLLASEARLNALYIIVDHSYRKNSAKEAKAVKSYLAKSLKLKADRVVILTNKKPIPKTGVEEFLRELRYDLIFSYLKKNKIKKILMAHHLDDQVETFLMRLERGAGLDGLTGIKESSEFRVQNSEFTILRPLLSCTKDELKELLKKNKIKWWEDPSNENIELTRNNIRKTLSGFSDYDVLRKRISTVIENIERAKDFIEAEKEKALKSLVKVNKKEVLLEVNGYRKLHEELRLRVLRDLVKKYSKTQKDVRLSSIKNLDKSLTDKQFKAAELHGIRITKKGINSVIFK